MTAPADQPVGQGEDLTLESILREAEASSEPMTMQEFVAAELARHSTNATGPTVWYTSDPQPAIADCLRAATGRLIGHAPMWLRFHRPSLDRSLILVLHSPTPEGAIDLLMVGHPGVLNRAVLRAACRWAFFAGGWRHIVAKIPTDRPALSDYLRRAGFTHQGVARGYFLDESDASVWSLSHRACRWLPQQPPPIRLDSAPPPSSSKVH